MIDPDIIGWAAETACVLEVSAEKPGNVTRVNDFDDACFEDFIISAVAIGPAFRNALNVSVGETILMAIKDTRRLIGSNTNLGIVLLLAPLAKAMGEGTADVRTAVRTVLDNLTVQDTQMAYEAIRMAGPGGMGTVRQHDVREKPVGITLYEAMNQACDRDAVAREYVTGFEITFDTGLPALRRAVALGLGMSSAVVQAFLTILSQVPDTLISRKKGEDISRGVSKRAEDVLKSGGILSHEGRVEMADFDHFLRSDGHNLNPGTTADLVTAALFVYLLEVGLRFTV